MLRKPGFQTHPPLTPLPLIPGEVMREASVIAYEDFTSALPRTHPRQEVLVWTACGQRFPAPEEQLHATPLSVSLTAAGVGAPLRQTRDRTT